MKLAILIPAIATLCTGAVFAQAPGGGKQESASASGHPDFVAADTDKDGLLSISELQAALPDVKITDKNADGFVNQSEAEAAIEGLAFESQGYTGGSSLVSEAEYGLILSSLESELGTDAGARTRN